MEKTVELRAKVVGTFDGAEGISLIRVKMRPSHVILFRENFDGHYCTVDLTLYEPGLLLCAHCNGEAEVWHSGEIRCAECHATAPDADTWNNRKWARGAMDGT